MEQTIEQQIFSQLKRAGKILVILPENLNVDSVASGAAMKLFLTKLQKDVVLFSSGRLPEVLKFLPGTQNIQQELLAQTSLVVTLNTAEKKLEELSYQSEGDKVHIYLRSKSKEFTPQDITFAQEKFPVDLIIVLGAKSLENLGTLYEKAVDVFSQTPKINIDNKSGNDFFGSINLVDITATSVSEILSGLFQKYEQQLVDEDIATCLLAGIIEKTGSFQHIRTTPSTFIKASELIAIGGRQQEVIKHIFKTKSMSLLKLWGRALARIKLQERAGVIYSILNFGDFEKAECDGKELPLVMKEFVENISGYKLITLLSEPIKGSYQIIFALHNEIKPEIILETFGNKVKESDLQLSSYKVLEFFSVDGTLEYWENKLLEAVKRIN